MTNAGRSTLPANPLKATTEEIFRGWHEELSQLQRRWNEIKANAQVEREEGSEEAEGLRLRLQALRDLISEAIVVGGDPSSWRRNVPAVRLGSMVQLEFEDGTAEEFLFVGLAGPNSDDNVLTPKTPLGAAILGRKAGETVAYQVGSSQFRVTIKKCLVPESPSSLQNASAEQRRIFSLVGQDEFEEAAKVVRAISALLHGGLAPVKIAISWRAPYQSGAFEAALAGAGIRYTLEAVEGFYALPAIQGLLALLRLALNPGDGAALFQAMRTFTHVPAATLEKVAAEWAGLETVWPGKLGKDKSVLGVLQAVREISPKAGETAPVDLLGLFGHAMKRQRPELFKEGFRSPWPALLMAASAHKTLKSFLEQAEEIHARSHRGAKEGVILTPLEHLGDRKIAALFLVGANEGAIPFLDEDQPEALPNERELFFDALTAADQSTVSWAKTIGGKGAKQSRFLTEVAAIWKLVAPPKD